jgi:hypothetical protein
MHHKIEINRIQWIDDLHLHIHNSVRLYGEVITLSTNSSE